MKRRSLLVGSALASVGAILGVGKAITTVEPTKGIRINNQGSASVTTQAANIWDYARDVEPTSNLDVDLDRMYPLYTAGLVSRGHVLEEMGLSGYEMQQLLDPPAEVKYALPMDRVITASTTATLWINGAPHGPDV